MIYYVSFVAAIWYYIQYNTLYDRVTRRCFEWKKKQFFVENVERAIHRARSVGAMMTQLLALLAVFEDHIRFCQNLKKTTRSSHLVPITIQNTSINYNQKYYSTNYNNIVLTIFTTARYIYTDWTAVFGNLIRCNCAE